MYDTNVDPQYHSSIRAMVWRNYNLLNTYKNTEKKFSKVELSIIIPAYCPEIFLNKLFERIKVIDRKLFFLKITAELIFLHNGTEYSLKKIPKLKTIKFQYHMFHERLTPAMARNIGISHSNGRYLLFHDVDDLLNLEFPDAFHTITRHLIKEIDYDLIIFKYRKIKFDG